MAKDNLKAKKYSPKPWWDKEIKEQRKRARRAGRIGGEWRREAAILRNMIKQKKREHWSSFVEETVSGKAQDIWQVIRVARNPFNTRKTMPAELNGKSSDEDKARAITEQYFQGSQEAEIHNLHSMKGIMRDKEDLATKILRALSTTNDSSTLGPDRISYRLLKLLKGTKLGMQVVHTLAKFLRGEMSMLSDSGDGRDITVVMIPKFAKDHSQAKGWRPIILINCLLKLMDKVVANELQHLPVFHHRQYGSRKGKSAMDMVIVTVTLAIAPRSADYDYDDDGRRVSEANINISWTWNSYSHSPNLTNARYRMLREEAREKGEGGSFIDTAGLFYAIGNYVITDIEAIT